jgi:hypothetical protein
MSLLHATAPELEVITDVAPAWVVRGHSLQLEAMRNAAKALRERFASEPPVVSVRTFDRYTFGYPVRYGFWGMALAASPYTLIRGRTVMVQFRQAGALRTLLFNPSDEQAVKLAPFMVRQMQQKGPLGRMMLDLHGPLEPKLAEAGVAPESVDYVAFDHFHLQDLRGLVSPHEGRPARFPRARLLAQRREWDQWDDLHPLHQAFAVPGAKEGIDPAGVVLHDIDARLGDGVMLVRTPGHTSGNQSLFFKTDTGIWGVSENGVSADNWSPQASRIRGVRGRVGLHGLEVLPNMNTPESTADQYLSMIFERSVVDPARGGDFLQMYPSFEVTHSWLTPGIRAYMHGELRFGEVARPGASA